MTLLRKPSSRAVAGTGVLIVAALALTSCAGAADEATGQPSESLEPVVGGELVVGLSDIPPCIDPAITPYNNFPGRAVVDNLFEQDEETGEIEPWLATGYEVSEDGLTYTLSLRDDVTFSNGEPFDAGAVKATLDNAIEFRATDGRGVAAAYISGYVGSTVVDDQTVEVEFEQPKAGFIQALTEKALGIIWPGSLTLDYDERCTTGPIGTGPFVIEENVPDDHVTVVRREGYAWASPNSDNPGEAYLDALRFVEIPEGGVLTESLLSGEVDVAINLSSTDSARVVAEGGQIVSAVSAGVPNTLYPNLDRAPFDDESVRQAFQIGIDRAELESTIYNEYNPAPSSIVSDTVPGHIDLSDELAYDPDAAKALLEDAGWEEGDDGIREKDGQRLTLVASGLSTYADAELLQQQWKAAGIDVPLLNEDTAASTERLAAGDYDFHVWTMTRADPDILNAIWNSDRTSFGYARAVPSDLDDLLLAQAAATDADERQELVDRIQGRLVSEAWGFPISDRAWVYGVNESGNGLRLDGETKLVFFDVWVDA